MSKLVLIALVLVALLLGGYFLFSNSFLKSSPSSPMTERKITLPGPISSGQNDSDEALDNDLTALEKDLVELEKSDNSFVQEINTL